MGVLRIYTYPDEVLLKRSDPLENIDGEVARLAEDMANTMYLAPGAGLAANQVGRPVRLVVLDVTDRQDEAPRGKPQHPAAEGADTRRRRAPAPERRLGTG